jgi:hypothetical protein
VLEEVEVGNRAEGQELVRRMQQIFEPGGARKRRVQREKVRRSGGRGIARIGAEDTKSRSPGCRYGRCRRGGSYGHSHRGGSCSRRESSPGGQHHQQSKSGDRQQQPSVFSAHSYPRFGRTRSRDYRLLVQPQKSGPKGRAGAYPPRATGPQVPSNPGTTCEGWRGSGFAGAQPWAQGGVHSCGAANLPGSA